MTFLVDPSFHMWFVIVLTVATMVSFAVERVSMEVTALVLLATLLLFFQIFPLPGPAGENLLNAATLLQGFANPSLVAVLALLVIGQAMVQTDTLTPVTAAFLRLSRRRSTSGIVLALTGVLFVSAVINNTPVVVMFIPILQILAVKLGQSASKVLMPLSFAAILGGMTTLIGSSTNLLVSSALTDLGHRPLGFFEFTVPGGILALAGAIYVIFVLPRLLPDRAGMANELLGEGKQFIAELDIGPDSPLIGQAPVSGHFPMLKNMTVRLVQRGGQNILPPFEDLVIQPGDILIVAATRQALTEALANNPGYMLSASRRGHSLAGAAHTAVLPKPAEAGVADPANDTAPAERVLAEVMIAPASRMIDQSLEQVGFQRRFNCLVLGIQRRARMLRQRMGEIRLQAGDVLLILGRRADVEALRTNSDVLLMAWSTRDLPRREKAPLTAALFLGTVTLAATGVLPISVAAVAGAVAMIALGCINIRQATRALDRKVFLLVGSTLALGTALDATGGAAFLARSLVDALMAPSAAVTITVLFGLVAAATNVLSNNACAILFTPIAVELAATLGIDSHITAVTVVLAANCSFATPIGYQTNLLVMGPGHYRFRDFLRGGLPLVGLMWLLFGLIAPWWFGL